MKVYISGPITGLDIEERRRAFAEAEEAVKAKFGCEVVNPLKDDPEGLTWEEYMKRDIKRYSTMRRTIVPETNRPGKEGGE